MELLPSSVRLFLSITIALTALSAFLDLLAPKLLGFGRSHDWPFGSVSDPFRDFYLYKPRYEFFHRPEFFTFRSWPYMYPAPLAVVSKLFYSFPHSTVVFLATMALGFVVAIIVLSRSFLRRGMRPRAVSTFLILSMLTTTAFILDFQQANLEFVVWLFLSLALWAFFTRHGYLAAICIGIAASMKIYPLVFAGLLLSTRQFRQAAIALLSAAGATILSLWLVCPDLSLSYREIQGGLAQFRQEYVLQYQPNIRFDHSLFATVKVVLSFVTFHLRHKSVVPGTKTIGEALAIYLPLVAISGAILYLTKIRLLPIANQLICFTVAIILLPPVSYDYTLIHLYAVLAVLFVVAMEHPGTRGLSAAFACLAVPLSSVTVFTAGGQTLSGMIKCVILLLLFGIALRYPFPSSLDSAAGLSRKTA